VSVSDRVRNITEKHHLFLYSETACDRNMVGSEIGKHHDIQLGSIIGNRHSTQVLNL
jgi:hypothetical protein